MKFSVARTLASFSVAASLAVFPCGAQTTPSAPPAPATQPNQQSGKPNQTGGKVIFERSINSNGDANGQPAPSPAASEPAIKMADAPTAEDVDRQAVTFTDLNLDVRLHTAGQQIAVRGLVTVRNTGKAPLPRIPLQISSSLIWERIRIAGRDVSFPIATLNSDGVEVEIIPEHAGRLSLPAILGVLAERKILSLLLETGSHLNGAFLRQNLVDKLVLFHSEATLGEDAMPFAHGIESAASVEEVLLRPAVFSYGADTCITGYLHDPWADTPS